MSDKEVTVVLSTEEEVFKRGGKEESISFYVLDFPKATDSREVACFELANIAVRNNLNPQFDENDIGYIRDILLGVTYRRLHQFWSVPGENTIHFRFSELPECDPKNDVTIVLNTRAEEGTQFIIMND